MNHLKKVSAVVLLLMSSFANATVIDQWADSVINYSSQWNSSNWAAAKATGAPDSTLALGDSFADVSNSWAPSTTSAGVEWITLGYNTAVYATEVGIRETDGGGFVTKIELIDDSDVLHTIWSGTDVNAGVVYDFVVNFGQTSYLVDGVKITIDTTISSGWDEIDAVRLTGCTDTNCASVPAPAPMALIWLGIVGLGIRRSVLLRK